MKAIVVVVVLVLARIVLPPGGATASSATATEKPRGRDVVFVGTVKTIALAKGSRHPHKPWAVVVSVDRIISGDLPGSTFTFVIHSPAKSGLKVGASRRIEATWTEEGYVVDELQWRRR
jgi:hypothetical protein